MKGLIKLGSMAYKAYRGASRGAGAVKRGAVRAARNASEIASGDFRRLGQAGRNAVASGYKAMRRARDKDTAAAIAKAKNKINYSDPMGTSNKYRALREKTGTWDNKAKGEFGDEYFGYKNPYGLQRQNPYKEFASRPTIVIGGNVPQRLSKNQMKRIRRQEVRLNRKTEISPKAQSWGGKMALGGMYAAGGAASYFAQKRQARGGK